MLKWLYSDNIKKLKNIIIVLLFTVVSFVNIGEIKAAKITKSEQVFSGGQLLETDIEVKNYTEGETWEGSACEGQELRCLSENILTYLKKLIIPISVVLLTFSGIYLLIVRNDEEVFKKRKNEVFGVFTGFIVILLSATLIDNMFFGEGGKILQGEDNTDVAKNVLDEINGILDFIKTFIVPIGVFVLILSVFKLILRGDDEEEMGKMKKRIIYIIVGISVILISEEVIKSMTEGEALHVPEAESVISIGISWINTILSFLGVAGVLVIVWAGTQMIFHMGDEERINNSKDIIKFVIIGLLVAFSAWTIIRFFLTAGA